MSAPSLAVVLAEHAGQMLVEMADALSRDGYEKGYGKGDVRVRIEVSRNSDEPFVVFIDEGLSTWAAKSSDAGRALLDANSKRQASYERAKARGVA